MSGMKDFLEDVRVMVLQGCSLEYIASCHGVSVELVGAAIVILMDDPDFRDMVDPIDDSMDGDHASALASAGWGTDEDYGSFSEEY